MRGLLGMVGGLALGTALSQFPEYAQQYTQRLGGAVDELAIITAEFDSAAAEAGLSRNDALARYAVAGDAFIEGRGQSMQRTFARYQELTALQAELRGASGWDRLMLLPRYADSEIGARALEDFQPAVPVTLEGAAYAGGGFVLGYGLFWSLVALVGGLFRRRRGATA